MEQVLNVATVFHTLRGNFSLLDILLFFYNIVRTLDVYYYQQLLLYTILASHQVMVT